MEIYRLSTVLQIHIRRDPGYTERAHLELGK